MSHDRIMLAGNTIRNDVVANVPNFAKAKEEDFRIARKFFSSYRPFVEAGKE